MEKIKKVSKFVSFYKINAKSQLKDIKKIEYVVIVAETDEYTTLSLYASQSTIWTEHTRGTCLMTIIDDGNGIILDRKKRYITYSEDEYLRILLEMNNKLAKIPSSTTHFFEITEAEVYNESL